MENIDFIPVFEWRILNNEMDKLAIKDAYKIADVYSIVGVDSNGNILVERENKLFRIDHEVPSEEPFLVADDFSLLKTLLLKLRSIQECSIETPLKEIRATKKSLVEIKKECPKRLRDYVEYEIESLTELISDYKFYQSAEGGDICRLRRTRKAFMPNLGSHCDISILRLRENLRLS